MRQSSVHRSVEKVEVYSVQELEEGRASWHRSCYKDAVHVQ